jgi:hypothetical protein
MKKPVCGLQLHSTFGMNLLIFPLLSPHLGYFAGRFHASFSCPTRREASHRSRNKRTSSAYFQILLPISAGSAPTPLSTPNFTQAHPMSPKAERIGRGSQPDQPITCDHKLIRFLTPPGLFRIFVVNTALHFNRPLGLPWVALGWPLGDPWVAQRSPKPNPKPNPRLRDISRGSQPQNAKTRHQPGEITRVAQPPSAVRF